MKVGVLFLAATSCNNIIIRVNRVFIDFNIAYLFLLGFFVPKRNWNEKESICRWLWILIILNLPLSREITRTNDLKIFSLLRIISVLKNNSEENL